MLHRFAPSNAERYVDSSGRPVDEPAAGGQPGATRDSVEEDDGRSPSSPTRPTPPRSITRSARPFGTRSRTSSCRRTVLRPARPPGVARTHRRDRGRRTPARARPPRRCPATPRRPLLRPPRRPARPTSTEPLAPLAGGRSDPPRSASSASSPTGSTRRSWPRPDSRRRWRRSPTRRHYRSRWARTIGATAPVETAAYRAVAEAIDDAARAPTLSPSAVLATAGYRDRRDDGSVRASPMTTSPIASARSEARSKSANHAAGWRSRARSRRRRRHAHARGHRPPAPRRWYRRGRRGGGRRGAAPSRRLRPDAAIVDIRMPPTHTDEGLVAANGFARSTLPSACSSSRSTSSRATRCG